jgi:hypothetical protein
MYVEKGLAIMRTPILPANPSPNAAKSPARKIFRMFVRETAELAELFMAAAFCAVSRMITLGSAAAVTACTGEKRLKAVEKYPIPSPPSMLVRGIFSAALMIFVTSIAVNRITAFLSIFDYLRAVRDDLSESIERDFVFNTPKVLRTYCTSLWTKFHKNA